MSAHGKFCPRCGGGKNFYADTCGECAKPSPLDSFMKFVTPHDPNDERGCWIWRGYKNPGGYGKFRDALAHRASYLLFKGAIPNGLYVLHNCDRPACVNPDHLRIGSQRENVLEMFRKGRGNRARGEDARSKLTAATVLAIKQATGSRADIARTFGISWSQADRIKRGLLWKHLEVKT